MVNENRFDLKISGIGNSSGGTFHDVFIDGVGKIRGDIDCNDFSINGVCRVEGSVKAKTGRSNGRCKVRGDLQIDEFRVEGNAEIIGSLIAQAVRFEGMMNINGGVSADNLENRGIIKVGKDLNSEVFHSQGGFKIGGLLNAGNIEIDLYAPCTAKEIGGEKIQVNMGRSSGLSKFIKSVLPLFNTHIELNTEVIEGDEIHLEYTKAKVVRGNRVIIGEGCEIELVEYKGFFEKSDKSVVTTNKNLD